MASKDKKIIDSETDKRNQDYYIAVIKKPLHLHKDSLFNSSSGYTNYRGLVNLCYIILVLSNFRVALENILKYGILFDPLRGLIHFFSMPNIRPLCSLLIFLNIFILISFFIEKSLVGTRKPLIHLASSIAIHLTLLLSIPILVFNYYEFNPIVASFCCSFYSVVFLKLISYHMVNYWYRETIDRLKDSDDENVQIDSPNCDSYVTYPKNLTISDLYYFMFAPTLCYELNFPRTKRIRKRFIIKRTLEIVEIGLIQQWLVPAIQNSVEPFMEMSLTKMLERLLKLAVPNHLLWLILFYLFFHSYLNLLGEIVRFADREFYRDWWNSDSIEYFWRTWNIPVHRWCVRHVYVPLLSYKFSNLMASSIVFIISAFFHEYLVSVPLKMYRIWAFTGMFLQVPIAFLVNKLNKNVANYAVWLNVIIGQPLCILMYYHDFYLIHILEVKPN